MSQPSKKSPTIRSSGLPVVLVGGGWTACVLCWNPVLNLCADQLGAWCVYVVFISRCMRPEGPWQRLAAALADSSGFLLPLTRPNPIPNY